MGANKKLYILYVGLMLIAGTAFALLSNDDNKPKIDEGKVRIVTSISTSAVHTTAAKTYATSVRTTSAASTRTTTASALKTSAVRTTVANTAAEEVLLWLDINSADALQLAELPGIGPKTAEDIVSYRENCGYFRNIEEIMNVSGIGEGKFNNIREYIYVESPVYDTEEQFQEESSEMIPDNEEETEHILTIEDIAPLDLNTATKEELLLLPHVDDDIAEKILNFREQAGRFRHPYELLYIDGLTRENAADIVQYTEVKDISETSDE